jgi:hypothetical protein
MTDKPAPTAILAPDVDFDLIEVIDRLTKKRTGMRVQYRPIAHCEPATDDNPDDFLSLPINKLNN